VAGTTRPGSFERFGVAPGHRQPLPLRFPGSTEASPYPAEGDERSTAINLGAINAEITPQISTRISLERR